MQSLMQLNKGWRFQDFTKKEQVNLATINSNIKTTFLKVKEVNDEISGKLDFLGLSYDTKYKNPGLYAHPRIWSDRLRPKDTKVISYGNNQILKIIGYG